jgi:hypothetical protein
VLSQFSNLVFLSVAFNTKIELQQKVLGRRDGQKMIGKLVYRLRRLNTLYIFNCPTDRLVIHSNSLERMHIYRSEFAAIKELKTPKLRKLMFHSHIQEQCNVKSLKQNNDSSSVSLFEVLYDGCPALEYFNHANFTRLKPRKMSKEAYCQVADELCTKKYNELTESSLRRDHSS